MSGRYPYTLHATRATAKKSHVMTIFMVYWRVYENILHISLF